ncbi:hypothetical protein ACFLTP_05745 [Chloroflexota bacterium]
MSKLLHKLYQVSQTDTQPLGFNATQSAAQRQKMLLVVCLTRIDADNLADYITGADAGLLDMPKFTTVNESLKKMLLAKPNMPWGIWLRDLGQGKANVEKTGCDFIIFSAASTPLTTIQIEGVSKLLEIKISFNINLLRTVNDLPVDAVLTTLEPDDNYFLTWHHFMFIKYLAGLLVKPILVSIPASITDKELQALWEAGADGVIVAINLEQPAGRLNELRQIIDKQIFPSRHKQTRREVLLPYTNLPPEMSTEEEE